MSNQDTLSVRRGDTLTITGTLFNVDGTVLNIPIDATLQWRLVDASGAVVRDYTRDAGITVTSAVNGIVTITLNTGDAPLMAVGSYTDQFRVTIGTWVSTQWIGTIEVKRSLFVP